MANLSKTRNYLIGIVLLAVLGAAVVVFFAWRVHDQLSRVGQADMRAESRFLAGYVRDRIERALEQRRARLRASGEPRRVADPETWALLDPELSEAFAGLPFLRSVQVTVEGSGTVCFLGDPKDRVRSLRPPVGDEMSVFLDADPVVAAFRVGEEAAGAPRALVNARLVVRTPLSEREGWANAATAAMIVVGVVIYLLATLAYFAARHQDRLLGQERLKGARFEAVGEVAAGIAHEVRNPLNAIGLLVQFFQKRARKTGELPSPDEYRKIHEEIGRIEKVVDDFVRFARMRPVNPVRLDLEVELRSMLGRLEPFLERAEMSASLRKDGETHCFGDRDRLLEAIQAILENAIREGRPGVLELVIGGDRKELRLRILDTRELSSVHGLERFFEPDFRPRDGAPGLAMTVARTLIESHGGSLLARARPTGGCEVTITLPRRIY